jgi:hypothetical protein
LRGALAGTEMAEVWESIGMPSQDWWFFRFTAPSGFTADSDVVFGTVGENWKLLCRMPRNICLAIDEAGRERFANSSFVAFAQMLAFFDEGYRNIQRECRGDSGSDWNRGDVIIQQMETSMRLVDPKAFEKDFNLWPSLLVDING